MPLASKMYTADADILSLSLRTWKSKCFVIMHADTSLLQHANTNQRARGSNLVSNDKNKNSWVCIFIDKHNYLWYSATGPSKAWTQTHSSIQLHTDHYSKTTANNLPQGKTAQAQKTQQKRTPPHTTGFIKRHQCKPFCCVRLGYNKNSLCCGCVVLYAFVFRFWTDPSAWGVQGTCKDQYDGALQHIAVAICKCVELESWNSLRGQDSVTYATNFTKTGTYKMTLSDTSVFTFCVYILSNIVFYAFMLHAVIFGRSFGQSK